MSYLNPLAVIDETAHSVLIAVGYVGGSRAAKRLADQCFRRGGPLIYSLPCRLHQWEEVIGAAYGTGSQILREYTCFPAFAAGMDACTAARCVSQLTSGTRSRTSFPRLPPLLECGNRYGLRCPVCCEVGGGQPGRTVSLRKQAFPFVSRCALHGERLRLADDCSAYEAAMLQEGTGLAGRNSRLYAWAASQLLKTEQLGDIRGNVVTQLTALGYADEGPRWKAARFSAAWTALSNEGFEDVRLTLMSTSEGFPSTLMRALTRTERPMHPAWLALLCWFLLREAETSAFAPTSNMPRVPAKPMPPRGRTQREPTQDEVDGHRSQWLRHVAANRKASRTNLRRRLHGVWSWLRRHDAVWLGENQPAPTRKHVPKNCRQPIGHAVAARVETWQIDEKDARGMPHMRTMYQNRIRYGLNDYAYDCLLRENPALAGGCLARRQLVGIRADHLRHARGMDVDNYSLATKARFLSLRPTTVDLGDAQTTTHNEGKVSVTAGPNLPTNDKHHAGRKLGGIPGAASQNRIKSVASADLALPVWHQKNNEAV